jgi:thiol-disulfide isomerase/thioredoxin
MFLAGMAVGFAVMACLPGFGAGKQAPEFRGIANWINSEPLTLEELRGRVVLIDFWTCTCVNCIRTMPYLKDWHAKYADQGLVIVGVHAPEFEFEKFTQNVIDAAEGFGLDYPIAQDNDFATWAAYRNRFWPAKYLLDQEGVIRYNHFGEGAYRETEERIRGLLEDAGADLTNVTAGGSPALVYGSAAPSRSSSSKLTREIYGGFERNRGTGGNYIAQERYYKGSERVVSYDDPGEHQNHFIYLQGPWYSGIESLRHARATEAYEDYIGLKFFATSVNAVIDTEGSRPFDVRVTMDGRALPPEEAGPDLEFKDGRSFFTVDEGRMYEVVALPEFGDHELRLSSNSDGFGLFAFTFGAYAEGP